MLAGGGLVAGLVLLLSACGGGGGGTSTSSNRGGFSPVVRHTGRGPTGYTVTFRYRDRSAKAVLIQGEWYFSNPALTTSTSAQGVLP